MSVVQLRCPACSAPLPIQPGAIQVGNSRIRCSYCGAALNVEQHEEGISVELADRVITSIEQSGSQTQAEVRRLQQTQELSTAEMRLANIQSEMRMIQRGPINAVSRSQLEELNEKSIELQQQIAALQAKLYPNTQSDPAASRHPQAWRLSPQGIGWMLFSFNGRSNRVEYWAGMLVSLGIYVAWLVDIAILRAIATNEGLLADIGKPFFNTVSFVQIIFLVWIGLAASIKRFHDRDKAGWWVLLGFIPVVGAIWFLIDLGILPGSPGANRYG